MGVRLEYVPEKRQKNVDEEVGTAASDHEDADRRDYGYRVSAREAGVVRAGCVDACTYSGW